MSTALTGLTSATTPLDGTESVYVVQGGNSRKATTGDLYIPGGTDVAVTDGGTGSSTASGARSNLGLVIGTDVQAHDADLDSWAAITRASGYDTFAATPSSANLKALLTDETGSGAAVFATSPVLVTPNLGTPSALTLTNATGLPIAGGGTGASTVAGARLNFTLPVYVSSVATLQGLDTTKDICAYLTLSGRQFLFNWTAGNFSSQITAADPRYIASTADPTGAAGAWIQSGSVETGQFFQTLGASVHYLADRVMVGNAVNNKANPVASQTDWLTTFLLARGRSVGFLEFAQMGVLNNSNSNSANAIVSGSQTSVLAGAGNSIGAILVGVNNNSSFATNSYGQYTEAYKMSGATGGTYGIEIDTINYDALAATNPFAQSSGQVVGIQIAGGAGLSTVGQFDASVGVNFWNNNAAFVKGINFGFTSITGTNGTDGNTGEAIAMATGHAITYYYGNNTKSWTLKANIGVNGNYVFSSAGTGSVVVPTLTTGSTVFFPSGGILDFNSGAYTVTHSTNLLSFSQGIFCTGGITSSANIRTNNSGAGIGYSTGAGGTVTQATSKSTGVTLNKSTGQITMNAAALAAGTIVSFVLTDSAIAATDLLVLNHISGGTPGSYSLNARCAAGSATIDVRNNTAGSLSEAIVIAYALIKGVTA